ncbi:MAG: LysR family transcriptional regulator [Thermoleophilia bacterium]
MELRQLEYLIAVVEEGGFTRGAARVRVAQPGVSAQIRRLEAELGETLIDRTGRTARPTAAGEAVLPYARAAVAAAAGVRQAVEELRGLLRGRVAVGAVSSIAGIDLAGLLAGFRDDHPQVEISLAEGAPAELLDAVRAGGLDLAILSLAGDAPPGIATRVLMEDAIVVAVPPDDALARRRRVPLASLTDRPLICPPAGSAIRAAVDAGFARAGTRPRVAIEAANLAVLADLAERGLGVALLPASLVEGRAPRLAGRPTTPAVSGRLVLAWRAEGPVGPAARELIRRARA